ncbi:hypothetical protein ACFQVC_40950 [Streptomyces monticola]|uniref:DUF7224 domain-containing protein n=1 Tax=Streptomyces monticola TaxID=2666263 RepID=A0ABW2JWM6_9ACTN
MLLRALLRSSSALVGLPLVVVFVLLALQDDLTKFVTANYWPSAIDTATFALPFLATACAALGAWEGARLDRGQVLKQTAVRTPLGITLPLLVPVVATGMIGLLTAGILTAAASGASPSLTGTSVLLVAFLLFSANALIGYLVGRRWPAVVSVPVALVGAFIANAYPVSWEILWIRHLVGGGLRNCCAVDQVLDPRALWSAATFALALITAAVITIQFPRNPKSWAIAPLVALVGIAAGSYFAQDLGPDPVRDRPRTALVCENGASVRTCLWPEVQDPAALRKEVQTAVTRLRAAGVTVPSTLTMAARPAGGEAKLGVLTDDTPDHVPAGVASGLLPEYPACASDGPYPAAAALEPVAAWLMLTAGAPRETVSAQVAPEAAALALKVKDQPQKVQRGWYATNTRAMQSCTAKPTLVIGKETT